MFRQSFCLWQRKVLAVLRGSGLNSCSLLDLVRWRILDLLISGTVLL